MENIVDFEKERIVKLNLHEIEDIKEAIEERIRKQDSSEYLRKQESL